MHAMPVMIVVLCCLAIAFRFYSRFLATRVAALDDARMTPAHELNDGQNYHPTNKWVLFGHHFAAISGAGPLIGPVLAIQFGYMPGLIWILVGVCLAGAVQDMLVLTASVRHKGKSLAEIARAEIGPTAGNVGAIAILFVVIIALAGLGVVVVKALGGETVNVAAKTVFESPEPPQVSQSDGKTTITFPSHTATTFPSGTQSPRSESFAIVAPEGAVAVAGQRTTVQKGGVVQPVKGSSWGTFTIACTVPIALFIGIYLYKIRKGRVVEASLIGAGLTLAATYAGNWIPGSTWEPYFLLSKNQTTLAICSYGFIASVLPVWLLLCPRDYLSSFLKLGTLALLVGGVIVANPLLEAPAYNTHFTGGGGPYFSGPVFPFCFICIMCGAVSGFHALVSSGTTPKMVSQESHIPLIGYGSMLLEGLVGIVALIAAAALPQGDYWAINIDLTKFEKYSTTLEKMQATQDNLTQLEEQVGGEQLRGRTGGAVTLAVGMSKIFTDASRKLFGDKISIEAGIKYWFHFAIMFEALFILTTIDTGTRIARFLLQEMLGKLYAPFAKTDWLPGAVLSTALVTAAWGGLIYTGSISTIWPMFGIANQMLAVIALATVTSWMFNNGRGRYSFITIVPMLWVMLTTTTAGVMLIRKDFWNLIQAGRQDGQTMQIVTGVLSMVFTIFIMVCVYVIVAEAVSRWCRGPRKPEILLAETGA